jgi:hypothetical protein
MGSRHVGMPVHRLLPCFYQRRRVQHRRANAPYRGAKVCRIASIRSPDGRYLRTPAVHSVVFASLNTRAAEVADRAEMAATIETWIMHLPLDPMDSIASIDPLPVDRRAGRAPNLNPLLQARVALSPLLNPNNRYPRRPHHFNTVVGRTPPVPGPRKAAGLGPSLQRLCY